MKFSEYPKTLWRSFKISEFLCIGLPVTVLVDILLKYGRVH